MHINTGTWFVGFTFSLSPTSRNEVKEKGKQFLEVAKRLTWSHEEGCPPQNQDVDGTSSFHGT